MRMVFPSLFRPAWAGWIFFMGCLGGAQASQSQQLIPVIRQEVNTSSVSVWKAFLRVSEREGRSYVSLVQIAALFDGHLHWRPVARQVDLRLRGHVIRFLYDARTAFIDGRRYRLERSTLRNDQGFWVPARFFASPEFYRAAKIRLDWPPAPPALPKPNRSVSVAAPMKPKPEAPPAPVPSAPVAGPPATPAKAELGVEPARAAKAVRRIVIDPGHGGKDPGTVSARGVEEKTINLLLAQELADILREREGYEVLMTRTDDSFIPLADRAKLANRHEADLFISLHCNSSLSVKMRGFEVYFLSEKASDPHADAVARLENAPLALEGDRAPSPREVEAVLRALVKTAYINESSSLGSLVDRQMRKRLSEPSLGVKQAAFYVLRGAEMPAILVETGFLSNVKDARRLQKAAFRARLIDGLAAGIKAYDERKQKERR